ncbi:MAG TPA: hypothetical protein VK815_08620 [Candidatus Acidoferrales bacterium]|jgi:hypothetical protein|nr:hypothetical protein [Candidatus Acidoferrales bacterium]
MRPAFASAKQAAAFAGLLVVILALPALMGKNVLPPRSEIYTSTPAVLGPYHYLQRQIFEETNDIDIAFIGSSRILHGIYAPKVEARLSKELGRPAVVITLGWDWAGFDANYFIAKDLLQHRKVKMIVFSDESRVGDKPHHAAPRWFRFGDDAGSLGGLPLQLQAAYYFGAVIGMPRNLLSLTRTNYASWTPAGAEVWGRDLRAPDPATTLGTISSRLGVDHSAFNFVDFKPTQTGQAANVRVYSAENKTPFQFSGPVASPLQLHFGRKFATLAVEHGCKLVCVHLPEISELRATAIQEREFWPDALQADVTMLGIAPAKLFEGLSEADASKLFLDPYHFNQNGLEYFTPLICPALLEIYDTQVQH